MVSSRWGQMGFNAVFKGLNVFSSGDYMPIESEDKQHIGCDFSVSGYYNKLNLLSYRVSYNINDLSRLCVNICP